MHGNNLVKMLLPLAAVGFAACGDSTGPNSKPVSLSFSTQGLVAAGANFDVTVTGGGNTVVITKAQLVIRDIKLKQSATAACVDDDAGSDDCDELKIGPFLADLPLTATATSALTASIPAGTYREVEFKIHKPGSDAADAAFSAANPNFATSSVRVEGTINGTPFVFTNAISEKIELEFNPAIVIDGTNKNVTVQVNVASWFKSGTTVIDPRTANPGQPNANTVSANIRAALRAVEDDDKDGK